jgi:hypothetical protein
MQMGGHDAELQHPRPFLARDDREVLPEVGGPGPIEGRLTIAGGPDDVDQEPMMRPSGSARPWMTAVPFQRTTGRFSDVSRAVA